MNNQLERFITTTKLTELRQQQQELREAYRKIRAEAVAAESALERILILQRGLKTLTFAQREIHPDVARLDIVPQLLETSTVSRSDFLQFWLDFFMNELNIGLARTTMNYLFGALLEEKLQGAAVEPEAQSSEMLNQLVAELKKPPQEINLAELSRFFKTNTRPYADLADTPERLQRQMDTGYLSEILTAVRHNPFRPARLRYEADQVMSNPKLLNELSDAMTILLENLDKWTWPETPAYTLQTGQKWRLLLDESLPDAVLIEVIGDRWPMVYGSTLTSEAYSGPEGKDRLWTIDGFTPVDTEHKNSIVRKRIRQMSFLNGKPWLLNYTAADEANGTVLAVNLVHAEINVWSTVFPERPLTILKFDLKDFYASLSHDLLLTNLAEKGVDPRPLSFIERWLAVNIRHGQTTGAALKGVPNDRRLSHAVGEALLAELDRYIYDRVPVQIVRIVDDICILAGSEDHARQAIAALDEFLALCGLQLNEEKSGAVVIHGEKPADFPPGLPTWKYLQLRDDGQWQVDARALAEQMRLTREAIAAEGTILGKVQIYNLRLRELLDNLGLQIRLGDLHRQEITAALNTFHNEMMDGQSITTYLAGAIRAAVPQLPDDFSIMESWFYWPITAGGLGVLQPFVILTSYNEALKESRLPNQPDTVDAEWQTGAHHKWYWFYDGLLRVHEPARPQQSTLTDSLVDDFIQRGTEVSGKKQKDLSPYWRWVLHSYGPQMIHTLGSFRFLISELVPLQLILGMQETDDRG